MPLLILYRQEDGQVVSCKRFSRNHSANNYSSSINALLAEAPQLGLRHLFIDDGIDPVSHCVKLSDTGFSVVRKEESNVKWLEPLLSLTSEAAVEHKRRKRPELQYRYVVPAGANPENLKLSPGITIFVPALARWHCLADLFKVLAEVKFPEVPVSLVLYDNSNDSTFGNLSRWFLAGLSRYADVSYVNDSTPHSNDRTETVRAVARIYNDMTYRVNTEFILTLEDDVLPQSDNFLIKLYDLLRSAPEAAAAAANVVERHDEKTMCWQFHGDAPSINYAQKLDFVQKVDGVSFSCTLWRTKPLKMVAIRPQRSPDGFFATDICLCADLKDMGLHCLIDWNNFCSHVDSFSQVVPLKREPFFARESRKPTTRAQASEFVSRLLHIPTEKSAFKLGEKLKEILFGKPKQLPSYIKHLVVLHATCEIPDQVVRNLQEQVLPEGTIIVVYGPINFHAWSGSSNIQFIDEFTSLKSILNASERVLLWDSSVTMNPESVLQLLKGSGTLIPKLPSVDIGTQLEGRTADTWVADKSSLSTESLEAFLKGPSLKDCSYVEVDGDRFYPNSRTWANIGYRPKSPKEVNNEKFLYIGPELPSEISTSTKDLTIGMTCINHPDMTIAAIESLLRTTEHLEREILVFDNGSSDPKMKELYEKYKDHPVVQVLRSEENKGYIYPMNFMAQRAKGEFYVVANNDIIAHPGWFEALSAPLADPTVGQTGPPSEYGYLSNDMLGGPGQGPLDYLEGFFFMVPRRILDRYPLFDAEHLTFATHEDVDFSLRLRQLGYRIVRCENARVDHLRSFTRRSDGSIRAKMDLTERQNKRYMLQRWSNYLVHRHFSQHRVLVTRKGANGDLVAAESALKGIRWKYPHSFITLLTDCSQVMEGCPWIDEVRHNAEVGVQYDLTIDLNMVYENDLSRNRAQLMAKHAQVPYVQAGYWVSAEELKRARDKWKPDEEPICIVHWYASWESRRWPLRNWRHLVRKLEDDFRVIEMVSPGMPEIIGGCERINTNSFKERAAVIKLAKLAICIDSVFLHVCTSLQIPTIGLFGPTIPSLTCDSPYLHPVMLNGLECLGCHHDPPYPKTISHCFQPRLYCQEGLQLCTVFKKVMQVMKLERECHEHV